MTRVHFTTMLPPGSCGICKAPFNPKVKNQRTCGAERCMRLWATRHSSERHREYYHSHPKRDLKAEAEKRQQSSRRGPHPILAAFGPVWAAVVITAGVSGLTAAMTHAHQLTAKWADRKMADLILWVCQYRLTEGTDRTVITGEPPLYEREVMA